MEAEPGADVVQDKGGTGLVGEGAGLPREGRNGEFLREAKVVAERRDEDGREVGSGGFDGGFQACRVVVVEGDEVRAVRFGNADDARGAPGDGAVIRAPGDQYLTAARRRAGDGDSAGGGVRPVLGEDAPVGMGDGGDEEFGKFDEDGGRAVHAVASGRLGLHGGIDGRVMVAEDDRPPGAHEVDEAAAVRIVQAAALGVGEELRVAFGKAGSVHVAP